MTLAVVGLDFGSPPFWPKRIPPLLGQKADPLYIFIGAEAHCLEVSTSATINHAELTSESSGCMLDAEDDLDGSADESEPESEGGSDAAEDRIIVRADLS